MSTALVLAHGACTGSSPQLQGLFIKQTSRKLKAACYQQQGALLSCFWPSVRPPSLGPHGLGCTSQPWKPRGAQASALRRAAVVIYHSRLRSKNCLFCHKQGCVPFSDLVTLAGQTGAVSPIRHGGHAWEQRGWHRPMMGSPLTRAFPVTYAISQSGRKKLESFIFILKLSLCGSNFEVCKDRTFSTGNFLSHWEGHRVPPNQVVEGKPPQLSWPSLMLSFLTSGCGGFKGEWVQRVLCFL